jgi:hypothetical protein
MDPNEKEMDLGAGTIPEISTCTAQGEDPNGLNTLFEGSARLNVSYWALYRGIDAGLIKGVRLGGRIKRRIVAP